MRGHSAKIRLVVWKSVSLSLSPHSVYDSISLYIPSLFHSHSVQTLPHRLLAHLLDSFQPNLIILRSLHTYRLALSEHGGCETVHSLKATRVRPLPVFPSSPIDCLSDESLSSLFRFPSPLMGSIRLRAELQADKKDKNFNKRKTVLKRVVCLSLNLNNSHSSR